MLSTKRAFEGRQNLQFWCVWVMCDIWWAVFKKASLRALPFIFRSEILLNDSKPVFGDLICISKQSSRKSWIVGSTLQIPSFSPIFFSNKSPSKTSHHESWCQKCHGKICQKICNFFAFIIFSRNAFLLSPQPKRLELFFDTARYKST